MVSQLDRRTVRARPGRALPRLVSYVAFEGRPATTAGQRVNPLVRAHLRAADRWAPRRPVRSPLAIVGVGRSGTTLLGRLLGAHPDVGFLNEPKLLWHVLVEDEDIIGSYSDRPPRLRLDESDATPERVARAHRLYGWYLAATRSRRVVDKYPELVYRAGFVRGLFPDVEFVAVLRHPWDVVTSITEWSVRHASADSDWWGVRDRKWHVLWEQEVAARSRWAEVAASVDPATADHATRAAVEWLVGTTAALELVDQIGPEAVHLVRYEDLVRVPAETVAELLERCGLTVDGAVVRLAADTVEAPRRPSAPPRQLPEALRLAVDEVALRAGCG